MKKFSFPNQPVFTIKLLFLFCIAAGTINNLHAQVIYKLSSAKENIVKVSGKSNVHDWNMIAQNPTCEASFGPLTSDDVPKSLSALSFTVNAKSLKSEHESMDSRTYKTIKADAFPQITFKLSDAVITPLQKGKFSIKASGTLTIAGVSKTISLLANGEVKPDNVIVCSGQEKIKLTDYNIQPPSFMLGAMKVADDLTISFTLNFKK
ncbi:YceI family protein [Pedobacter chinensis]|uniref:YceI family protein n=1 Tax=Pedobacter chinensis TaxID=2282421 RepID=A0A369Q0V3_9SPHI|nr:YceI family protein [Pedobacter chinensis]RDC55968.1 YceI family protein [Pedobacter chinensis]